MDKISYRILGYTSPWPHMDRANVAMFPVVFWPPNFIKAVFDLCLVTTFVQQDQMSLEFYCRGLKLLMVLKAQFTMLDSATSKWQWKAQAGFFGPKLYFCYFSRFLFWHKRCFWTNDANAFDHRVKNLSQLVQTCLKVFKLV